MGEQGRSAPRSSPPLNRPSRSSPAADKPAWLDVARPDPGAYVYKLSPGAAIFRHVCINCHGPNADGKGIQVDLLSAASEGEARPANFKAGLFGPLEAPLSNIRATFDVANTGEKNAADLWASRYMSWMALGGTLKRIPQDVLHLVTATPILGYKRENISQLPGATDPTGNMLNLAKGMCALVLPGPTHNDDIPDYEQSMYAFNSNSSLLPAPKGYPPYNHPGSPFIDRTYDKEMWLHLCSDYSPQVIRVYGARLAPQTGEKAKAIDLIGLYYAVHPDHKGEPAHPGHFPANAPVWDQASYYTFNAQAGLTPQNQYPACLDASKIPPDQSASRDRGRDIAAEMPARISGKCEGAVDSRQPGWRSSSPAHLRGEHSGLGAPWRDRGRHVPLQLSRATHERSEDGEAVAVLRSVRVAAVTLRARDLQTRR